METPAARVATLRESLNLTQRSFAKALGTSQGTVGTVENGSQPPSRRFLRLLSERYNVSADWVLYGTGTMLQGPTPTVPFGPSAIEPPDPGKPLAGDFRSDGEDFALVRVFSVQASAGNGLLPDDEHVSDRIAFSRNFLLAHGLSPNLCGLVRAAGISMEPLIPDGALMLADFTARAELRDGIHIFRLDGELFVKRLMVVERDGIGRPGRALLLSENPAHPPREIAGEALANFRAIGRVVTVIRDL